MTFRGEVVAIHVATEAGAPMTELDVVEAIAGRGLAGDRYADASGTFSEKLSAGRQVTLIESEALDAIAAEQGIELAPGESRRNLTTRGVPLNHLVGREFTVGGVRLRGVGLCEPCGHLQRKLEIDQLVQTLAHRAGLKAEIVDGGAIRTGDAIEPAPGHQRADPGDPR